MIYLEILSMNLRFFFFFFKDSKHKSRNVSFDIFCCYYIPFIENNFVHRSHTLKSSDDEGAIFYCPRFIILTISLYSWNFIERKKYIIK